jgi:predicted Zn-dependent protease
MESFRRLTLTEIENARPLRLKLVTVQEGDTIEKMVERMPAVDRPMERFLIINGLQPGQALKPGEQVKIVVE